MRTPHPGKTVAPRAKTIAFHICILNPDVTASIHRVLEYVPGKPERDFFTIEVTATSNSLEMADGRGWRVLRSATARSPDRPTALAALRASGTRPVGNSLW